MRNSREENLDVESYLKSLNPFGNNTEETLKEVFDRRLNELKTNPTEVRKILNIGLSTLNGLLNGTQKMIDFTNLIKIANFLQISNERVILLYLNSLEKNNKIDIVSGDKVEFIKNNFDLAVLKKSGFIDSVSDFDEIERRINSAFELKSVFDYKKPNEDVAFSAGKVKPKNDLSRSFWIKSAIDTFRAINNPNPYNKQGLIDFFPDIRWHSTNVNVGLINVIRSLFKLGITVVYQPPLSMVNLRGATMNVNNKPCIVLTNYKGFYPTIFFALLHELHHVIFDWEDIQYNKYHISDDDEDQLSVLEREEAANKFAREYLFSIDKSKKIRPHLNNYDYITEFAKVNEVHPSFIYVFHAFDTGDKDRMAWARARRYNPTEEFEKVTKELENSWKNRKPTTKYVNTIAPNLYQQFL